MKVVATIITKLTILTPRKIFKGSKSKFCSQGFFSVMVRTTHSENLKALAEKTEGGDRF